MKRAKTSTFIAEFQLRTTPADERALRIRLDANRQIYNAAIGESLRRLDRMRRSKAYRAARELAKGRERTEAFRALNRRFQFTEIDLVKFTQACRNDCWIRDHLGSQEAQAASRRAFKVVEQYAFGKRGRPRFCRYAELNSVENQTNTTGLRFIDNALHWRPCKDGRLLSIPIHSPDEYQIRALKNGDEPNKVKFGRVMRRNIRGVERWYIQVLMQGTAPQRREHGNRVVGIDIGPSNVAMVSDADAAFEQFCDTVSQPWKELRKVERAMDRSKRATNPDAFNENGTYKKGAKIKVRSRRYQALALKRRERERRLAAERKRSHGELANRVLGQGTDVRLEKLSYRSFQRNFGRSTKVRGAGMFVAILDRKIEAANGQLIEINPYKTALSQFDHTTGEFIKKPLSQRMHHFGDGTTPPVQRDLYSALLARCCSSPETLDVAEVERLWPALGSTLRRVTLGADQPAKGRGFTKPPVFVRREACGGRGAGGSLKTAKGRVEADAPAMNFAASERAADGAVTRIPGNTMAKQLAMELG